MFFIYIASKIGLENQLDVDAPWTDNRGTLNELNKHYTTTSIQNKNGFIPLHYSSTQYI